MFIPAQYSAQQFGAQPLLEQRVPPAVDDGQPSLDVFSGERGL